jgi:site-specific DNA-cytosine methylase
MSILTILTTAGYRCRWDYLDSRKHGGVPQSRLRVYIVASLQHRASPPFIWPREIPMHDLVQVLDNDRTTRRLPEGRHGAHCRKKVQNGFRLIRSLGYNPRKVPVVCDCHGIKGTLTWNRIPCLTMTRAKAGGFWIYMRQRFLTVNEMFRLQGMDPETIMLPPDVSSRELRSMLGDAFTQTVITRILARAIPWAGLVNNALVDPQDSV